MDLTVSQETPLAYRQRILLFFTRPEILDDICGYISNGGTLPTLANEWNIKFKDVANWIHKDDERETRYRAALMDRDELTKDLLMRELALIAMVDIRDAYDSSGSLLNTKDLPASVAKCVSQIEVFEEFEGVGRDRKHIGQTKKVRMYDKLKAIEMIGKQIGMFTDTMIHKVQTYEDLIDKVNGTPA